MDIETQLLFFLGIIGAFNSFLLSGYFAFFVTHRNKANYYLSALLLAITVKITASVLCYFDRTLDHTIIEIGLSANALIGPFLYFHAKLSIQEKKSANNYWWLHTIPVATLFPIVGYFYPSTFSYGQGVSDLSRYLVGLLMVQWFIYLVMTALLLRNSFKKLLIKNPKLSSEEIWLVSLSVSIFIFWLGPIITTHTTYMVGALSFSFIFYALLFIWAFKLRKKVGFYEDPVRYLSKKIETHEAETLSILLKQVISQKELFKNPDLKLTDVASELKIHPHRLSQLLNDNLGKSFSLFINEYRIEAAKNFLLLDNKYTLEAIGYECGFNSKSTFFTTFKKLTGVTPSTYKSQAV